MRIWRFSDPGDERFAVAVRRGAWSEQAATGVCTACSASRQVRVQPLVIAWKPGSDIIGDFTWPGFDSEVVVTGRVLDVLIEYGGFEPGGIEIVDDQDGPVRRTPAPKSHEGLLLHELWVTTAVHMDRDRSTVELEHSCSQCRAERWELYGVEHWDSRFDHDVKRLVRIKTDRLPGAGIYVSEAHLTNAGIFRVAEFPAWVFCTDPVRDAVKQEGFSNVEFLEMGETF
jgi:hypothetical protein